VNDSASSTRAIVMAPSLVEAMWLGVIAEVLALLDAITAGDLDQVSRSARTLREP
jgi:hypothetical protein